MAGDEVGPFPIWHRAKRLLPDHPWRTGVSATESAGRRLAVWVMAGWSLGYLLITAVSVFSGEYGEPPTGWTAIAVLAAVALVFILQMAHSTLEPRNWPRQARLLTMSLQASATYLLTLWVGPEFLALVPLLAASCLLLVPRLMGMWLFLAVEATLPVGYAFHGMDALGMVRGFCFALLTGLVIYGVSSLGALVGSAHTARAELAQRAVQQERIKAAQDIHDLIVHDLLVLKLKGELAHRLLPDSTARAKEELDRALDGARRARAEVQAVAKGHRHMSLAAEMDSVVSTLTPAGIEIELAGSAEGLPLEIDTVLAIALREAVTNMLRHSRARRCRIQVTEDAGENGTKVRLLVTNDGAGAATAASPGTGQGLNNLARRLRTVGGRLSVENHAGRFAFTAEVPLAGSATRGKGPRVAFGEAQPWRLWWDRSWRADLAGGRDPRMVVLLLAAVLIGHADVSLLSALALRPSFPEAIATVVCVTAVSVLQAVHSFGRPQRWSAEVRLVTLAWQGAATFAPLLWFGMPWAGMGGLFEGSILLLLAGWWRWALYAGVGLMLAALAWGSEPGPIGVLPVSSLLSGLAIYGMSRLIALVADAHESRARLARTAVDLERVRLAHALHTLIERNLSAIISRIERAGGLLPHRASCARHEIGEILEEVRGTLADVRAMAGAYRHLSLSAEVRSSESVLRAAGVEVETRLGVDDVPIGPDTVLAIALREAAVTVLLHRAARRCVIEVAEDCDVLRLRVLDDGGRSVPDRDLSPENHRLRDLGILLESVGGQLAADVESGWFRLTAEVPAVGGRPAGASAGSLTGTIPDDHKTG